MTDAASRPVASLAGSVKPRSVNWSAAFLYSCRFADLEFHPEPVQRAAVEPALDGDPGQPEIAGRLQVDGVERGGQVVRHVAGRELAEGLRPGDGQLARLAELPDRGPQFLHHGQADAPAADLGDERPDPAVVAGPPQAVEHVGEQQPAAREHGRRQRVGGPFLDEAVRKIKFKDNRGSASPAQSGELIRNHRFDHAASLWAGPARPGAPGRRRRLSSAAMADRDGNGWVRCAQGHRHWGRFGAAGLLAYVPGNDGEATVLLQRRGWWSHHPGTWGPPGGARDSHESCGCRRAARGRRGVRAAR